MEPGAQELYTMPGSQIRTLGNLTGRTIAINAPNNILYLLAASVLTEHGMPPEDVRFVTKYALPAIPAELKAGAINAAVLPEPFASIAEESDGAVPLADLNQGATTSFPVEGYVVTKQWAQKYPHTLAAFYQALEQGQQIADSNRAAVEQAMEDLPSPLGLYKQTAALISLDEYPVSAGPAGTVDKARLERVVNVMHAVPRLRQVLQHQFDADKRRLTRAAGSVESGSAGDVLRKAMTWTSILSAPASSITRFTLEPPPVSCCHRLR